MTECDMTEREQDSEARIVALETRLAYQDDTIDKLNAAITAQWAKIDVLSRQIAEMRDLLQEAESRAPAMPGHEPPPHY